MIIGVHMIKVTMGYRTEQLRKLMVGVLHKIGEYDE